ncbi:mono-functional DNA-alkylating methyl methanesulfonate N-term-domain-containing protein [Phakopsora pachyrhizi]|uniref:Mono-functional DNA-alkylating methyl methanesulfonate N-term-domain-containing protein n=1 Tax=Phakopsora pachyrhizi TaxID=170000 RepID=A0AAV0AJ66_PHAPC|nr:mono-functional DNA-alkylating methyl methanesulfonate N-term-domain-containing protein [Phakopsora pachyrhizi]
MLYLAHALLPTSTRHALKCDFITPSEDSLIIGKHSAIQVYHIRPEGLKLLYDYTILGVIEYLQSYKKPTNSTATIIVLTSELDVFTLRFCPESEKVITTAHISLKQIGTRPADHLQKIVVDHHRRCVAIHALNGILHIVPLEKGFQPKPESLSTPGPSKHKNLSISKPDSTNFPNHHEPPVSSIDCRDRADEGELYDAFQLRLNEVNVHALEFAALSENLPPILLIVYSDQHGDRVLKSRHINFQAENCEEEYGLSFRCDDPSTGLIIPIINHSTQSCNSSRGGGTILVGEESAELAKFPDPVKKIGVNNRKGKTKLTSAENSVSSPKRLLDHNREALIGPEVNLPLGSYVCFCRVDDHPDCWLLGDLYGNLLVLNIQRSKYGKPVALRYEEVGKVSSPEALVYLSNGYVFLASHYGDSQLLKVFSTFFNVDSEKAPSPPEVITSFTNLAPISDFCVVEDHTSSESHLVTCSGAYRDGSLRIIKHGIPILESGFIKVDSVQKIWALKSSSIVSDGEEHDDFLILSFFEHTRFLSFLSDKSSSVKEVENFMGFRVDRPTIVTANMVENCSGSLRHAVQVTPEEVIAGMKVVWRPDRDQRISAAAVGSAIVAISTGLAISLLFLKDEEFHQDGKIDLPQKVSSLALDPDQRLIAAGQWVTNNVHIYSIETKTLISQVVTGSEFLVNSLLMTVFDPEERGECRLLIGFGDGKIMNMAVDSCGRFDNLSSDKRMISLGTRPIEFVPISSDSKEQKVWVNTDRPSLISKCKENGRHSYHAVASSNSSIISSCEMNSRQFKRSVVLAQKDGIRISKIDESKNMQIVKVELGCEQPRRIAHSVSMRAYGVICVRVDLDQTSGVLHRIGSVKIFDDTSFELLYDFKLLSVEQGSCIAVMKLDSDQLEHFVIGTGLMRRNSPEANSGRILAIRDQNAEKIGSGKNVKRAFKLTRMSKVSEPVLALGALPDGKFVASANAFVDLYGTKDDDDDVGIDGAGAEKKSKKENEKVFNHIDSWGGGFYSQSVVTDGTKILVGDLYRSISLLELDSKLSVLSVKARDYTAAAVRPVGKISDGEFIGADSEFNVFTVMSNSVETEIRSSEEKKPLSGKMQIDGEDEDENEGDEFKLVEEEKPTKIIYRDRNLYRVKAFHLGENINQFKPGSLNPRFMEESLPARTSMIFVTSTGGIGIIATLKEEDNDRCKTIRRLARLELQMNKSLSSIGNLNHQKSVFFFSNEIVI